MGAVFAARDMAAERHRAAALDGRHHLQLIEADVPGIGAAPCRPVVAEDIRNLQRRTGHRCGRLRRRRVFPALLGLLARPGQQVERALDADDHAGGDTRVARRRLQFVMTERTGAMVRRGIIKGRQLCRGAPWAIKAEDLAAYSQPMPAFN